ncbi:uncharacterized protein TRIADDRAFT_58326 [Trichoplax adhaerens]|uniref:ApaG domain-containing protein n=1 Tax=Trichoplax adhaerens TaxID=10228 RepID=B3S1K9_TRIAD|nr:hypothetical protein TRIADDRAFT_58326 [Trichoplax adhaerens]EDV23246.1 hypothetical protein TRIADDRAFT_58326 [Trichoplax adhaerens]|eukprot:XP_002114156.1 hypothetical protein TRIADDRAFT_58326 [Trichoplax adhaerens]
MALLRLLRPSTVMLNAKGTLLPASRLCRKRMHKLATVGVLTSPKVDDHYQPGQLFLHRFFGYRGVVLYRWPANLYDRDEENIVHTKEKEGDHQPEKAIYYQVLVDQRDAPHVKMQRDSITFLGNSAEEPLYSLPGFDYLSHDDVLPYKTVDKQPIKHNFFNKFFEVDERNGSISFNPRESLKSWHDKNHHFLELSAVYRCVTNDLRVTVLPFYMGSRNFVTKEEDVHYYWHSNYKKCLQWRYCVRIENLGTIPVRLINRHWIIRSGNNLEEVHGRGVVGMVCYNRYFNPFLALRNNNKK